jgi:hypothetical protein
VPGKVVVHPSVAPQQRPCCDPIDARLGALASPAQVGATRSTSAVLGRCQIITAWPSRGCPDPRCARCSAAGVRDQTTPEPLPGRARTKRTSPRRATAAGSPAAGERSQPERCTGAARVRLFCFAAQIRAQSASWQARKRVGSGWSAPRSGSGVTSVFGTRHGWRTVVALDRLFSLTGCCLPQSSAPGTPRLQHVSRSC